MTTRISTTDRCIETAKLWLAKEPVFLDTETTGLDHEAEICDIAIVDYKGRVLVDTYIKPTLPIPTAASNVHGITDEVVATAPTWQQMEATITSTLKGRHVIIYNAEFDIRMFHQSNQAYGKSYQRRWYAVCAMQLYAEYYGQLDDYRETYRWQKLSAAAEQCGLEIPENLHRAVGDAELTRQILIHMSQQ